MVVQHFDLDFGLVREVDCYFSTLTILLYCKPIGRDFLVHCKVGSGVDGEDSRTLHTRVRLSFARWV